MDLSSAMVNRLRNAARGAQATDGTWRFCTIYPIGIQLYLLSKCLGYIFLQIFGGLSTFSNNVWIQDKALQGHIFMGIFPYIGPKE